MTGGRPRRSIVGLVVAIFSAASLSGAALASPCKAPKSAAKVTLELRQGDLQYVYDLNTAGIRNVVNDWQGYVAGSWHLPIGLTVAEFSANYETKFFYRKAQSVGHCVALSEAKVSVGYDDITVYVSSEHPEGSCQYDIILAHEHEHVRINRELLGKYEAKFKEALRRVLRSKRVIYAHRKAEARSAYILEFQRQMKRVVAKFVAERNRKHSAIDTQDNYRRLMAQCANWGGGKRQASVSEARSEPADIGSPVEETYTEPSWGAESVDEIEPGGGLEELDEYETAAVAPSEPVKRGPKTDQDLVELVRDGSKLTKANARQLESALKHVPHDFPTRARLLGFYFHSALPHMGRRATIKARRRHILWLIENHPESSVAGLPEAIIAPEGHELADEEAYRQARDLWLEQAEKRKHDEAVRRNAAKFLQLHDKAIAETLH